MTPNEQINVINEVENIISPLLLKLAEYQSAEAVMDGGNDRPLQRRIRTKNHSTDLISKVIGLG